MAFGSFDHKGTSGAVSEINMVPLIDVMLVLLVIFIITAPLMAHSIRIETPQASAEQVQDDPKSVDLAIDAYGDLFLNEQPVTLEALSAQLHALNAREPKTNLRIRADLDTRYELLAQVMAAARRAGLTRIGFMTTPAPTSVSAAPAVPAVSGPALPAMPGGPANP